jgi:hypothetical protein
MSWAMPSRPISSRVHGIIDYATGVQLLVLPALLGIGGSRSSRVLRIAGLGHLAYAALTRYELGIVKKLPFRTHLALDAAGAAGLVAAPWLLGTRREGVRHWLPQVVVGLNEAVVTALTDPAGQGVGAPASSDAGTPSAGATPSAPDAAVEPTLSPPDPKAAVMPDGAEANDAIGARTIGGGRTG